MTWFGLLTARVLCRIACEEGAALVLPRGIPRNENGAMGDDGLNGRDVESRSRRGGCLRSLEGLMLDALDPTSCFRPLEADQDHDAAGCLPYEMRHYAPEPAAEGIDDEQ